MDKPHWLLLELFELDRIREIEYFYQYNPINNNYDSMIRVTDQQGKKASDSMGMMVKLLDFEPDLGSLARLKLVCQKRVLAWRAENKKCHARALVSLDNGTCHHVRCVRPEFEDICELCQIEFIWERNPRTTFGIMDETGPIGRSLTMCDGCYSGILAYMKKLHASESPRWLK